MQIKTTMKYFIPVRMVIIENNSKRQSTCLGSRIFLIQTLVQKRKATTNVGRDVEKKNSYTVLVDVYIVIPIMKNNMRIPKKLKVYLLYDSAIPFL